MKGLEHEADPARGESVRRALSSIAPTSTPSSATVPASQSSSPAMQLSRVDLPTPDSPTMATNSPGATVSETLRNTRHRRSPCAGRVDQTSVIGCRRNALWRWRPCRRLARSWLPARAMPAASTCASIVSSSQAITWRCRHAAQPGQLPLGQLPRGDDAAFAPLRQRRAAVQRLPGLAVTDAAHRRQVQVQVAARAQAPAPRPGSRASSMASKRCAMRSCSQLRCARFERQHRHAGEARSARAGSVLAMQALSGRPVSRYTSSARWMRWLSLGASRAAVTGSTGASSACIAGQPFGGGLLVDGRANCRHRPAACRAGRRSAP